MFRSLTTILSCRGWWGRSKAIVTFVHYYYKSLYILCPPVLVQMFLKLVVSNLNIIAPHPRTNSVAF